MTEPATTAVALALAFASGSLVGAAFYGGLWWTVRHALVSPRPALWFLGSLVLRTGIAMASLYLVGRGDWQRLVLCLIGFAIARPVVIRVTRSSAPQVDRQAG